MTTSFEYARDHAGDFVEQLKQLLRIPSVSTFSERAGDVERAAEWLAADLRRIGLRAEIMPTGGHPVVYAEWLGAGADAKTVLIYGHYDVQPADVEKDGWHTNPFEPVERDGILYARGVSDDKGQIFAHIKALEALLATDGRLPVNVKVLIEGEEEISSLNLSRFVAQHRELLAADVCIISDSGILSKTQPSIVYALRGLIYMELHVFGPSRDLHSGGFGGTVHNPAQALAEIIAALHNPDGSVNVPGFYEDVAVLSADEREALRATNWTDVYWQNATGAPAAWGEAGFTFRERIGARPTLEINGILSGFTGEGAKTVLPATAMAKISCRLVAGQTAQRAFELVRERVRQLTPPTVRTELRLLHEAEPVMVDIQHPMMNAAIAAYERGWGNTPLFVREGGTIGVATDFQHTLGLPVLLLGFGLDTDGAHGPDEHFDLEMFHRGIATSQHFLHAVAEMK